MNQATLRMMGQQLNTHTAVPPTLFQRPLAAESEIEVLDLFAGAGGLSLGFEAAGARIRAAVEIDEWACDTLRLNHPSAVVIQRDIALLSDAEVLSVAAGCKVVVGGPPCQGFSVANRKAGDPNDPRNSLFKEFVRVVSIVKPEAFLLENVPGLLKRKAANGQSVIDIIVSEFTNLGYQVNFTILEAQAFGVPQLRPRLFVAGFKHTPNRWFPAPTHGPLQHVTDLFSADAPRLLPYMTVWEAISDLPDIEARSGAEEMDYSKGADNPYQLLMRAGSPRLYNNVSMRHSARMVQRFSHVKCGDSGLHVPHEHLARQRGDNSKISEKHYSQNNRRMHPDRPCHTIPASFYANFIHPFKHRNFTPREGARLQSFPDWYRFEGKPTVVSTKLLAREERASELHLCQYNQIGNAVPPLLGYNLAKNLIEQVKV